MIEKETAARIWNCYQEIENSKKLIENIKGHINNEQEPTPRDSFGRRANYKLGVPTDDHSHTIYDVNPRLALSVVRSHMAEKQREIAELNEQARIDLEDFEVPQDVIDEAKKRDKLILDNLIGMFNFFGMKYSKHDGNPDDTIVEHVFKRGVYSLTIIEDGGIFATITCEKD